MVKMCPVEANAKVISMWKPYAVEHTTLTSKQFHAFPACYINKTFILYTIHRHKIHEQSIFPRSFIFVFNSKIDSLYLTDWGKLFNKTLGRVLVAKHSAEPFKRSATCLKKSAERLKSSAVCLCYNLAHVVQISHGIFVIFSLENRIFILYSS